MDVSRLFPRDPYGRIALFIASTFFVPVFGSAAYMFLFTAKPHSVAEWVCCKFLGELFAVATLFFLCGFIWALATPHWLERLLESVAKKFILAVALFMVPFGVMAIWALFVG